MSKEPRKAALTFIFITVLIDVIGLGIIIPVIPSLIVELTEEGLSKAAIYGGWLMFVYAFTQFVFAPVIGGLSDRFGRRPVLLFSLLGFGIDYILIGFAPTIFWLFVARLISGITGASHTTASAYIADISEPDKRAQNFGLIGAAFGLGFIIGPVVGGLLGQLGSRVPFFAAAGLTFVNVLYGYFILPESLPPEKRRAFDIKRANPLGALKHLRQFPGIGGLILIFGLIYLSSHATQSTWTYFTMLQFGWNEAMVGISLGVVGVSVFIVQGGLTRVIIPKIGEVKSVYFGLLMYCLGFLGFAFAPSGLILMFMIAPFCLGGLATPSLQGIISNKVPDDQQGELQGALTSLISFTAIFGPPMMTGLFGYFTSDSAPFELPGAAFVTASILILLSIILAVKFLRKSDSSADNTTSAIAEN
ncbi:MAG TPA: tetracycline resistance MFS efflux pump [Balneola sp.]|jgi:MFS transporter, DHA1 family, tetracycline resistance protein|nr:tetracycline resistance MFS efflux pump [Balneola sp.]MAO78268.1 tetracycline resistance MFS efflux pump [Balneola sp.]MBF64269.1 tetracycline resistance MFS efflux pump [Balneola sp.]HAH50658.1 tetracycline resistance MFS efflux pump [Balneola sp.]|tara:strand:+ start:267 stop:1520 length:1254 start_codon:yes stop_codon:yes gene_type:complete